MKNRRYRGSSALTSKHWDDKGDLSTENVTHLSQTPETGQGPRGLGLGAFSNTVIDLLDLAKLTLMDTN